MYNHQNINKYSNCWLSMLENSKVIKSAQNLAISIMALRKLTGRPRLVTLDMSVPNAISQWEHSPNEIYLIGM